MTGTSILAQSAPISAPAPRFSAAGSQLSPLVWLMGLYVFFFPIQFGTSQINLAPSDLFLCAAILFCFFSLRLLPSVWSPMHIALILCFLGAAGTSIYLHGTISPYVVVKIAGLFALFASYLCLTNAARNWNEIRRL